MDSGNEKKKRIYKKKKKWGYDEESFLINLWEDHIEEFRGCRRNSHIYEEIKSAMANSGFLFSCEEIKVKIHNLTNKYRDEKRKVGPSGGSPSTWTFFDRVHLILGPFKANSIEELMDESIVTSKSSCSSETIDYEIETLYSSDELDFTLDHTTEELPIFQSTEECPRTSSRKNKRKSVQNESLDDSDIIVKKKRNSFQSEVLQKLQDSNDIIKNELEKHSKAEDEVLQLHKELVVIEKERNEILRCFLKM